MNGVGGSGGGAGGARRFGGDATRGGSAAALSAGGEGGAAGGVAGGAEAQPNQPAIAAARERWSRRGMPGRPTPGAADRFREGSLPERVVRSPAGAAAMTASLPKVGDVLLGKYRVDQTLGAGGMGAVMAATHTELGQEVAI